MRVVLVGVTCVGKTTVGGLLADAIGYDFVDFDAAVQDALQDSIERIKRRYRTELKYRKMARHILEDILAQHPIDLVLSMPPGGLFEEYKTVFDRHPDIVSVALYDEVTNILNRLVFYDEDSQLLTDYHVNADNRDHYLNEIELDIDYYKDSHSKAKIQFHIDGRDAQSTASALAIVLSETVLEPGRQTSSANPMTQKASKPVRSATSPLAQQALMRDN